jgi:pSer/pThr/pTyr-binding forkhead associated (FHA) protein
MTTHVCPKGHLSIEADYCSECGSKIQSTSELLNTIGASPIATNLTGANHADFDLTSTTDPFVAPGGNSVNCPACGAPHLDSDGNFCEICGYNFSTGQPADVPIATLAPPPVVVTPVLTPDPIAVVTPPLPTSTTGWTITLRIDPSLATPASPPAPTQAPIVIPLNQATSLIGRTSDARGVRPEIPLDFDDAVSHRHALLVVQPDGSLMIRDVGSSNGVQFNGQDLAAMADVPLQSGDVFSLGHWTKIEVQYQTTVK